MDTLCRELDVTGFFFLSKESCLAGTRFCPCQGYFHTAFCETLGGTFFFSFLVQMFLQMCRFALNCFHHAKDISCNTFQGTTFPNSPFEKMVHMRTLLEDILTEQREVSETGAGSQAQMMPTFDVRQSLNVTSFTVLGASKRQIHILMIVRSHTYQA